MEGPSPYDLLIGVTLEGGWVVVERASSPADTTGGRFSFGYWVERATANRKVERAFCKVLNYSGAVESVDPLRTIGELTDDFRFEVEALELCGSSRMRRVVLALDSGTIRDKRLPMEFTSYIVLERADGSLRAVFDKQEWARGLSVRLQFLHDAAAGLAELHRYQIGHQDLKASNVLVVDSEVDPTKARAKVSDLGRSTWESRPSRQDGFGFPGDPSHQPPEYFYKSVPSGYGPRRLATDLYQLGSLICFVLCGARLQPLIYNELPAEVRWDVWAGKYEDVEPYVRDATVTIMDQLGTQLPSWMRDSLIELLNALCDSDPYRRNGLNRHNAQLSQFRLNKVLTRLDVLSKRARVESYKLSP